jgi:transposase InsO family protein
MLVVIDEFTRECLAIDVARRLNSDDVLERLTWLMATRGVPDHIRSDNGSEFTAHAVRDWLQDVGVRTLFIDEEAKVLIERWRVEYNTVRPHSSLGYRPPAPEAVRTAAAAEIPCAALRVPQPRDEVAVRLLM